MSRILSDVYSVVDLQSILNSNVNQVSNPWLSAVAHIVEKLVICDEILLDGRMASKWVAKKYFPDVFRWIFPETINKIDAAKILRELSTTPTSDEVIIDGETTGFQVRTYLYLELARTLDVYFSPHPDRSGHLREALNLGTGGAIVAEKAIRYFEQKISETDAARMAHIDLSIPPVADYVFEFSRKRKVDLSTAIHEIRNSQNAVNFRKWCYELEVELASSSGRASLSTFQKLVNEIDEASTLWLENLDLGVKYMLREISLKKVWGIGALLGSFERDRFRFKDPVIVPGNAYLLFLNDIYRRP